MRLKISMLEAKVPPPVLMILLASIVWLLPRAQAPAEALSAVGMTLIVAGLGINAFSKLPYRRAGTSVSPIRPGSATALISSGPYRFSRNPMYLGYALALLGWAAWLAQPLGLLAVAGFIAYITRFQIMPEERHLSSRFPTQYAAYRRAVPPLDLSPGDSPRVAASALSCPPTPSPSIMAVASAGRGRKREITRQVKTADAGCFAQQEAMP